jgi:hypothetical protein
MKGLRHLYCITSSTKIAAAEMAEQLRKSTMGVPFHAIKRALGLKLQEL